eukprot:CAMPEP_0172488810 /NCGR_PEP_ID=MMETSP1066-20121228/18533_1 /TAXON_ID=671091 /ORGANISM="Coscinodiscus wailesii, Strain CCMP2513" /LENGTH=427 /DNA_ID=CAMNT_0013256279 /DNA_START=97 /DNA_END=1380 /DNA_ORIENTATION=+
MTKRLVRSRSMTALALALVLTLTAAFVPIGILHHGKSIVGRSSFKTLNVFASSSSSSSETNDDDDDDAKELSRRISQISAAEDAASRAFEKGLLRRARALSSSDEILQSILRTDDDEYPRVYELPVICFDALLPNQHLEGKTRDPTFCRFLRDLGLGGLFVMTSLNTRRRQLRRSGVVTRVELVDADRDGGVENPTEVEFRLAGVKRCRVVGRAVGMKERVGRWRRGYDDDGEESVLGWGVESFCDLNCTTATTGGDDDDGPNDPSDVEVENVPKTEWTLNKIKVDFKDNDEEDDDAEKRSRRVHRVATSLIPLLEKWQSLASDVGTYENTNVVAGIRRKRGQPDLLRDPSRLLRNVLVELGEGPGPEDPTSFAFWACAVVNPLPPLGVAPEMRGAMLEALGVDMRLNILERGIKRSIANLEGTTSL